MLVTWILGVSVAGAIILAYWLHHHPKEETLIGDRQTVMRREP